ncbi:hypothetical protein [Streptomyces sp. XY332]|uniref:hypothetical protein n=1 Tax=Streptomyces sp. XY332 TaxID=1415561 RepID=UPI000AE51186|nr:hypothetical protein [Streptomyces sp. XY332]
MGTAGSGGAQWRRPRRRIRGHGALEDRGVQVSCVVLEVTEHTETDSSMDAEGHWTDTTRTSYDQRRYCPAGGGRPGAPGHPSRLAQGGESRALLHDPQGKVSRAGGRRGRAPGAGRRNPGGVRETAPQAAAADRVVKRPPVGGTPPAFPRP